MKKSLIKNSFKSIIKTRRRFISILVMAFLGVGFYSGLVATGPDMLDTLNRYMNDNKVFDIDVVSTLGLNNDDIKSIEEIPEIENAYGIQTKDSICCLDEKESIVKVIEYNENINVPSIVYGRLPEKDNECVLDSNYAILNEDFKNYIGKTIILQNEDKNEDGNPEFKIKELKIVGIANSPLYISSERGNTSLGSGSISFFIYTKDIIDINYYSEIGIRVKDSKKYVTNSEKYIELIDNANKKIEEIKSQREIARDNELKEKATQKLIYSQKEFDEKEINKIEKAKWYITKRADNQGYSNIFDAVKTMTNISKIFPIVFYLVAVLISLTSMTRMIEEERIEIGTLKSLGYNNWQIISKYILYASLACIIGGAIGMSVGFYLLPNIVWILYSLIYTVPVFYVSYRLSIGLMGLVIAVICIVGATIYVAIKELKQMPAVLMRPKPPKNGKRVLLEKVTFIWKKLTFSKKVTIRNIFRYKKRAIMTIVGIAGCTGLMVTGFGIKDSVADIPASQFGKIFTYDQTVTLANTNGLDELEKYLSESQDIKSYCKLEATTGNIKNNSLNYDVTVFVPEDEQSFKKSCNLIDIETKEIVNLPEDGIILTDKIAEILSIKKGDEITFASSDNIEYTFKVNAIVENYVSHYAYMSKAFYEKNIKSYSTNMLLINTKEISEDERNKMQENILKMDGVASSTVVTSLIKAISDMLKTMNYVVVILVVSSAMLAFVVLYNLANINIGERTREIATLKVLGFFDKEVDNYINKENIIFTIIGVLLGMIFGAFLTTAIVQSVEIDKLRFIKNIKPISYIYSAIITCIFSFIVNSIIHFVLKKIDMIESLKSVE